MDQKELTHYLSVLVELTLFPELRLLTEGTRMTKQEVEQAQQKQIIQFINELPEDYKKMPNRDEIIATVLGRMNMQTSWGIKKLEELKMTQRQKSKNETLEEER